MAPHTGHIPWSFSASVLLMRPVVSAVYVRVTDLVLLCFSSPSSCPSLPPCLPAPLSLSFVASLPFLIIETSTITPYRRGFYCSDESIRYPLKKGDTISDAVLCAVGILIAIVSVSPTIHCSTIHSLSAPCTHIPFTQMFEWSLIMQYCLCKCSSCLVFPVLCISFKPGFMTPLWVSGSKSPPPPPKWH